MSVTTVREWTRARALLKAVIFQIVLCLFGAASGGCTLVSDPAQGEVPEPTPAAYAIVQSPSSILVVGDRLPGYERYAHDVLVADADLVSHFTPNVRWMYVDQLTAHDAAAAGAVIYIGDSEYPIPRRALESLRHARRIVLAGNHLAELRGAGVAFAHVVPHGMRAAPRGAAVAYGGQRFPYRGPFLDETVVSPAHIVAPLVWSKASAGFIVADGDATFVNAQIDFGDGGLEPSSNGYELAIADDLGRALGARPPAVAHLAMLRLEDVSVQTPVDDLRDIVTELAAMHVPYGIGVIPDQLIQGEHLETLAQDRGLVTILRWAQAHGATIVLHGLHHSFHSAEDFEFWDAVHDRPLPNDSTAWMDGRIEEGLRDEHAVGLTPLMWETPHYSASPVDYAATASYFTTVWEQRRPLGWAPWIMQRDQYGQRVLPEDLGYIAQVSDPDENLAAQMARAHALLVCRGCIAAGFLHPTTVTADTVRSYVNGLEAMGYNFADPKRFIAARGAGTAPDTSTGE